MPAYIVMHDTTLDELWQGFGEVRLWNSKGFRIWGSKSGDVRGANFGSVEKLRVKAARSWGRLADLLNSCHLNLLGIGFCHLKYA